MSEHARAGEGQREEKERERNPKQVVSTEPEARLNLKNHEIITMRSRAGFLTN